MVKGSIDALDHQIESAVNVLKIIIWNLRLVGIFKRDGEPPVTGQRVFSIDISRAAIGQGRRILPCAIELDRFKFIPLHALEHHHRHISVGNGEGGAAVGDLLTAAEDSAVDGLDGKRVILRRIITGIHPFSGDCHIALRHLKRTAIQVHLGFKLPALEIILLSRGWQISLPHIVVGAERYLLTGGILRVLGQVV